MGNIGDSISTNVPAVGASGPSYATDINALLTEYKVRLTAKVPLSSLLANSTFDMNGQAMTNLSYITLPNIGSTPGASPVNRITAHAGNFYWVGPSGAVQITNGASVNAAGIGGITGDYNGTGMEFRYDLGNTRYDAFATQSTNTWAYVRARGFDIAGGATSTVRARLLYGGAGNVTYTLPSAAPSASAYLRMDTSGNITAPTTTAANTLAHAEVYRTYDAITIYTTGTGTASGVTFSTNQPKMTQATAGDAYTFGLNDLHDWAGTGSAAMKVKRIVWKGDINGGGFPTLTLYEHDNSAENNGTPTATAVTTSQANTGGTTDYSVLTLTTPQEFSSTNYYTFKIVSATNNLDTYSVAVVYERS